MAILAEYKCEECDHTWTSNSVSQTKCSKCGHDSDRNLEKAENTY